VRALGLDAQRDEGRVLVVEWGVPYVELSLAPRAYDSSGRRAHRVLLRSAAVLSGFRTKKL
jgi:hypothetical protein